MSRSIEGDVVQVVALSQQDIESRLWDAANNLRGPVDPADFKAYVFPLLFFKWISDTWDMEHEEAIQDFGSDVSEEEEADYHRFLIPKGCHWSDLRKASTNVGVRLRKILDRLEQANPDKLAGIFGDVAWGNKERLPEPALLSLIDTFDRLTLNRKVVSHDMLGAAYEYLLKQFADESGRKAGEFFTPRAVVRLLVNILRPKPGETVYDPACGSGGMLVETINSVRDAKGDTRTLRLYGQEVNLTTAAIARMNLYLHDLEDFQVLRGDTLRDPRFREADGELTRFDVVIANPPFSLKNWGADLWTTDPRAFCGVPPNKSADFAWVQHMTTSMTTKKGRVGVVMPHGVLFRGGIEQRIRQCLIENDQLEAVIGLPPNLFYSTTIPACLLIFRARKPRVRRGQVLFVDGSARFTKGKNQNLMSQSDVDAIGRAYRSGDDPDGGGGVAVRLISHEEIQQNDWDLSVGRYIKAEEVAGGTLDHALAEFRSAQAALRRAEAALDVRLKGAGVE
jgi:type I restriction enzyme M protein